jgi:hypothetical protein
MVESFTSESSRTGCSLFTLKVSESSTDLEEWRRYQDTTAEPNSKRYWTTQHGTCANRISTPDSGIGARRGRLACCRYRACVKILKVRLIYSIVNHRAIGSFADCKGTRDESVNAADMLESISLVAVRRLTTFHVAVLPLPV